MPESRVDRVDHVDGTAAPDRRERKTSLKRRRIFEAAEALFAERGFDGVSTQQISDRADVAAGTLFRYASSKSELLLMVFNDEFRRAIERGVAVAEQSSHDPANSVEALTTTVFAVLEPTLAFAERDPRNVAIYERELLFGAPAERYRVEGLELVMMLEDAVAGLFRTAAHASSSPDAVRDEARRAARSAFAALHLLLSVPLTGLHSEVDSRTELVGQIEQIAAGFTARVEKLGGSETRFDARSANA